MGLLFVINFAQFLLHSSNAMPYFFPPLREMRALKNYPLHNHSCSFYKKFKASFPFKVVANERNSSAQPNATVTVNIEDVNEYNPVFDQPHYSTNISENTPNGTFVLKVTTLLYS